jgi:hypothetical protein
MLGKWGLAGGARTDYCAVTDTTQLTTKYCGACVGSQLGGRAANKAISAYCITLSFILGKVDFKFSHLHE